MTASILCLVKLFCYVTEEDINVVMFTCRTDVGFFSAADLLKGVLKQRLSGHRDLYMAGQGIGLSETKQINRLLELL